MLYSVDSIQQGIARLVAEDGGVTQVPLALLPAGVAEGKMVKNTPGGYIIAPAETEQNRKKTQNLLRQVLKPQKTTQED